MLVCGWITFWLYRRVRGIEIPLEQAEEAARAREAEARARAEHERQQAALREELVRLASTTERKLSDAREALAQADRSIAEAEREFAEGAFAPFWDAVEHAANLLARTDQDIRDVVTNHEKYRTRAKLLDGPPSPLALSMDSLPSAVQTADRMQAIVRQAQKNYEFSSIYEQRKTNKLLYAGFSGLGEALSRMSSRLERSVGLLNSSVEEFRATSIELAEDAVKMAAADTEDRRNYEERSLEILDNIQRRRKPRD